MNNLQLKEVRGVLKIMPALTGTGLLCELCSHYASCTLQPFWKASFVQMRVCTYGFASNTYLVPPYQHFTVQLLSNRLQPLADVMLGSVLAAATGTAVWFPCLEI